ACLHWHSRSGWTYGISLRGTIRIFELRSCRYSPIHRCGATMLMPVQSGRFKSINRAFPYLSRGFIVVLALVAAITSQLSASTTWPAAPSPIPSLEVLDRAHKADRLSLRRIERADHELPVGCESVVGSFAHSPSTHVARDCLT